MEAVMMDARKKAMVWRIVGIGVLAWVAYDLYTGYTLLWDVVHRDQDPTLYWTLMGIWTALGVYCLLPAGKK